MDVTKVLGEDVLPFRTRKPAWFKVPRPGQREVPRALEDDRRRGPAHGLQGSGLPEHRRLLGPRHGHVHDPRRHLHAPLRLLQRQDRQADLERPAGAAARRPLASRAWACATPSSPRVDRDDLPDYGASVWCGVIRSIRMQAPTTKIECLTPDFRGEEMPLAKVIAERPDVFNHNLEVAPRLYPVARRGSTWKRSAARAAQRAARWARARSRPSPA